MRRTLCLLLAVLMMTGLGAWMTGAQADTADPQTGKIVSDEPATNTPQILVKRDANGNTISTTTYSIAKVGNAIVVGGDFLTVRNAGTATDISRKNLFAFDATTGKVLTGFDPSVDKPVRKVLAAPDGHSVYVAGGFNHVGGQPTPHVVKIDVNTGSVDPTFNAPAIAGATGGDVRDLDLKGNHLFIAGKFATIDGVSQVGLGTLYADSGARDPYFNAVFTGLHNPTMASAVTDVLQMAVNTAQTELVAVGNYTTVDGQARAQVAKFDIGNAPTGVDPNVHQALSPWSTTLFTQACSANVETPVTDVEYAPNGTFFIVSSTGAYSSASITGTSGCDVVARFEENATAGSKATWTAYTGGDTIWTAEVTDRVVYVGGHQRWENNPAPTTGDQPGPGAVERTGIAGLDSVNGLPFSWNPTRTRGVGVQDMLATSDGLYVGSDTELLGHTPGNTSHKRIGFLPLAGGKTLPVLQPKTLPADVYQVVAGTAQLKRRSGFDGNTAAAPVNAPNGPGWGISTGAFMVNGVLYKVNSTGTLTQMTFNGATYGTGALVHTSDALVTQTEWHTDLKTLTSIFYSNGFVYYTKSGINTLYRRSFEVEDGVVGQQRFSATATGINLANVRGAFVASGKLYFATASGRLYQATWDQSVGTIVAGTVKQLVNAGLGWNSRALFPYEAPPN